MQSNILKYVRWEMVLAAVFVVAAGVLVVFTNQPVSAQTQTSEGLVCSTSPNATFTLTTTTGYIGTPDDNVVYMWGYAESGKPFQHPSPVLCVDQGDTVTIILHNTLPVDVSMTFPGQENVQANGVPARPQYNSGGDLTSLTDVAPANGGSVTYTFTASKPGTFLYQSGTNPGIQVRMGLFGVLVVRPNLGANYVYNRTDSKFNPDKEFLVLFSEIDPYLNQAVERAIERGQSISFNLDNYHPRYWMLNGRGFPDTVAPNFASWLPSQPYGALAVIEPYDAATNPEYALERFVNAGSGVVPMHPHAKNSLIIGRDGNPVESLSDGGDMAWENFSIPVGPGQTWDGIFKWENVEGYNATTNPVPVTVPNLQNAGYGPFYSGSPYLGDAGAAIPVGTTTLTQCGEYYLISHDHGLYRLTAWGVPMSGPITYMRVNPPQPNSCP
ncbi:MAG: hypothetical protein FOGNACKC_00347 [Anaerolineae bacterium]|nr:hypothetical protein [Anaerolineae bacterium]